MKLNIETTSAGDIDISSVATLNLSAANGVQISTATPTATGGGLSAAAAVQVAVAEINGEKVTSIAVDIQGLAGDSSGTAGYVIGNPSGTANASLTQITDAVNGIIYRVEMACIEAPTLDTSGSDPDGTITADIDLVYNGGQIAAGGNSSAGGVRGSVITAGGNWSKGMYAVNPPLTAIDLQDVYLYLVNGDSHTGGGRNTYASGKYVIKLYGANF